MRFPYKRKAGFATLTFVLYMTGLVVTLAITTLISTSQMRKSQLIQARNVNSMTIRENLKYLIKRYCYEIAEVTEGASLSDLNTLLGAKLTELNNAEVTFSINSLSGTLSGLDGFTDTFFPNYQPAVLSNNSWDALLSSDPQNAAVLKGGFYLDSSLNYSGTVSIDVDYTDLENKDMQLDFQVSVRRLPLFNFNLLAYGLPSSSSIPDAPPQTLTDSSDLSNMLDMGLEVAALHAKTAASDDTTSPDVYTGDNCLPWYYRDQVSLLWNTFEYLMGPFYQSDLFNASNSDNLIYNFTSDNSALLTGTTYSGGALNGTLEIDLSSIGSLSAPYMILDYEGANTIRIVGGNASDDPFPLVIRNYSQPFVRTQLEIESERPILLYAMGVEVRHQATALLGVSGMYFLDDRSEIDALHLNGLLAVDINSSTYTATSSAIMGSMSYSDKIKFLPYAPFYTVVSID
tara:strand:+ start:5159 stop:6535 length:1377 start_codon:yes stop_codon:yes gene_type:complete